MDYKEIKEKIVSLSENIDAIGSEAALFKDTRNSLNVMAGNLGKLSEDMSAVAKDVDEILKEVKDVAVTDTLESIRTFAHESKENIDKVIDINDKTIDEMEKHSKAISEEVENNIKQIIEVNTKAIEAMQKKFIMMGGIAVALSLISVVLTFIR